MGATPSSDKSNDHNSTSTTKNADLVVRDHTFDYDLNGIEYLKAHEIPLLFQDIAARLLTERPLDSLRFIRNILIHKVIKHQDHKHRTEHTNTSSLDVPCSVSPIPFHKNIEAHSERLHPVSSSTIPSFDIIELGDSRYDADKLLFQRTTARRRSYSDSAIVFRDLNGYKTNTDYVSDDMININLNALSQPISPNKYISKCIPSAQVSKETLSSIIDDMNIATPYKHNILQHLEHNDEHKECKDSPKTPVLETIAHKFQNTLKSLSNTAKSKLKTQIHQDTDDIDINRAKSAHIDINTDKNVNMNDDLYIDDIDKLKGCAQPLRRSRTMETLPSIAPFRHALSLLQRPCFGFDIGGSLTKISFFEPSKRSLWNEGDKLKAAFVTSSTSYGNSGVRDKILSFPWRNGTFHFIHFQTHRMSEAVSLWKKERLLQKNDVFYATGGGAHKYSKYFSDELHVNVKKGDELKCLISGLNFLLTHVSDECYYLSDPASKEPSPHISINIQKEGSVFPYILVNVGSGVSILKVDSATQFERVSGSQIGGGTYWGLCRLCCCSDDDAALTFKKAFEFAMKGNAKKVNMLVSDIYGGDYPQCNLPGDLVASAFGKCVNIKNPSSTLEIGDIARGLLDVIAMNCAQLAYLNAMRFKITRIIFAGNFLRQNDLSMAMISYAIHYWSQGVMRAYFLKHEGYFGSIGVMLLPDKELIDDDEPDVDVDVDVDALDVITEDK